VADAGHERDTGAIEGIHHAPGEGFRACLIDRWRSHPALLTPAHDGPKSLEGA
jgi:hypothetical protein